jgi:transposase
MGQRGRIITEVLGFSGWKVIETFFEDAAGARVTPTRDLTRLRGTKLVLVVERRWLPCCGRCGARLQRRSSHEQLGERRWADLPWAEHAVEISYAPIRVKCPKCQGTPVEMVAWAAPSQRQTRRLQQHLAVQCASMPTSHVAALHGLSWATVHRAEDHALERWAETRPAVPLEHLGMDEKWLGRRHERFEKFVSIMSNLATGEPIWMGYGRDETAVRPFLDGLTDEQKAGMKTVTMDLHRAFWNAVDNTKGLEHVPIVHDPFHVTKLASACLDELRRQVFFRASAEHRAIGRGKRWLFLRASEKLSDEERADLGVMLSFNRTLARAYQIKEELRAVLRAPAPDLEIGLKRILRRTQRRDCPPLRKLHDTLTERRNEIVALGTHRPPTGRVEALNNNWETLVRRGRGYRNHAYLLRKLAFMVANPIRSADGIKRFLALGAVPPSPMQRAA